MRIFLFDIDGTLIRAGGVGRRAMTRAFVARFGIEDPFADFDLFGRTDLSIVTDIVRARLGRSPEADEIAPFFSTYLEALEEEMRAPEGYEVLPGTREIVEHLHTQPDALLGLGTGNLEAGARLKLAPTGYADRFRFGGFGEDGADRAALLARGVERAYEVHGVRPSGPREVWVVGDSVRDVQAAHAIGATAVAITTGWQDRDTLAAERPRHLLSDMLGLMNLLR
jgi:phosphoglycolate phosphatase